MRFSLIILPFLLVGLSTCQRNPNRRRPGQGRRPGTTSDSHLASLIESEAGIGDSELKTGFGVGDRGDPNPSILPPSDISNCNCIPVNQVCEVPPGVVHTRIVNLNPRNVCPAAEKVCCFNGGPIGPIGPIDNTGPLRNQCGTRRTLVRALEPAQGDFGEYPWTVAIVTPRDDFIATGALISPNFILTAAHKILGQGRNLLARLGDYDLGIANEFPNFRVETIQVTQIIIHPGFNAANLFNDVALLRLQRPVSFTQHIRPVCLPDFQQRFDGARCWVAGFGEDENKQFSRIIREVDVPIIGGFDCEAALINSRELPSTFKLNQESFVCAGGEADKDACRGDGGAPLVCEEFGSPGKFTVVGLVAWGIKACGTPGVPGVYVNVASFANFIKQNI